MKFRVVFKTPDAIWEGIKSHFLLETDVSEDEINITHPEVCACKQLADKYIEYGELAVIEFDTADGSARILPIGK